MVVKEFLDSDRVNFLVWRYLLEGNYRETAAKFQKEWKVKEPHRSLAFARHVKGHALVSILNSGLVYLALEREHARRQLPEDLAAEADALHLGVFGPLDAPPTSALKNDQDAPGEEVEAPPGEGQNPLPIGSPPKRQRIGNGYENKPDAPMVLDSMDVDQQDQLPEPHANQNHRNKQNQENDTQPQPNNHPNSLSQHQTDDDAQSRQDNHASPPAPEPEQAPPPVVRTDGPEQGTQVEKVEELAPDTTFIHLKDEAGPAELTPAPSPEHAENAPVLLQCEWSPSNPSILAAAGTDALARVWTISRSTAVEHGLDHVSPHAHTLLDPDTPRTTTVTALAWTSDGTAIAVATDSGPDASVNIWSVDGVFIHSMEVAEPPVTKLYWNTANTALLALSPDKDGGILVTVYSSASGDFLTYHQSDYDFATAPPDAAWISDTRFLICGKDLLLCLECGAGSIDVMKKFETKEEDCFTQVLFDRRSNLAATSSENGTLDLWDENGERRSLLAHEGAITTMAWQPLPANQPAADDERLIATGGEDCFIRIWNARRPESPAKWFWKMKTPIVRLAFTPDGAFIAGATSLQVLIWKAASHSMPRASWSRPPHPGWLSPKGSADSEVEDEHCLCWDVTGQKLAYGSNGRLAVINFSR
ncbi:F-box-like/WD repeat-containing protein [Escovopsis weberi]|uniref:F-box-like/WD repeat-containing protein n=1 Tax=Escovopsis weberi TaxID=150374 RepID=A0A0M8N9P1_ESCWE|nr:F-box-like/WD repeat-containing protein [Escovopsis weberi]